MNRLLTLTALALVATALTPALSATTATAPSLQLEPCELPGFAGAARCGTHTVRADRGAADSPTIPLRVVVLPATAETAASDALIYFAGGPGASSVEAAGFMATVFAGLRDERDILLVDFRGTGESDPLRCGYQAEPKGRAEVLETFLPTDRIAQCRSELADGRRLDRYTTADIADDIEEVRAALGYSKLNLFGGSYGTRVAQIYLRRHPNSVRTVILEGVVPNDAFLPLTLARDAQTAFDQLVEECANAAACNEAFPHPDRDLSLLLDRLSRKPVEVEVVDPESGQPTTLRLSQNVARQAIRYMLYSATAALQLPLYLHEAAGGNLTPLAQTAYTFAGGLLIGMPDGLYLAVTCAEDVQFVDPVAGAANARNTFLGGFRLEQQIEACKAWGGSAVERPFHQPVRSALPVLMISGERDPVTPVSWGRRVEEHLSNVRHAVIPDAAHSTRGLRNTECLDRLMADLVRSGTLEGLDVEGCVQSIERPPFMLELPLNEAMKLTPAQAAALTGSYTATGFRFSIELVDGELWMEFDERKRLLALSPTRLTQPGAGPGDHLEFILEEGRAARVEMFTAGVKTLTFERDG